MKDYRLLGVERRHLQPDPHEDLPGENDPVRRPGNNSEHVGVRGWTNIRIPDAVAFAATSGINPSLIP